MSVHANFFNNIFEPSQGRYFLNFRMGGGTDGAILNPITPIPDHLYICTQSNLKFCAKKVFRVLLTFMTLKYKISIFENFTKKSAENNFVFISPYFYAHMEGKKLQVPRGVKQNFQDNLCKQKYQKEIFFLCYRISGGVQYEVFLVKGQKPKKRGFTWFKS